MPGGWAATLTEFPKDGHYVENRVALLGVAKKVPRRIQLSAVKRAEECLKSMGLESRIRRRPSELSGGERQRVAIARAFVNDLKLILADEPTGNLDSVATANVIELLHQLHVNGKTVVMVTHGMEIIKGTRILRVRDGMIES